ncbi:TPA: APC family permease [Candidatus Bathyarchaeota archaeon]|nr:APC family permease [Candidatus Bathyarchaeota archaeon]
MYGKRLRDILVGSPLPTKEADEITLNNYQALAALSPDALSSIAYANEELFLALVMAGAAGLSMSFSLGVAIVAILVILTISYYQTIQGYPSGGGSWIVARENLGKHAGLIAAAALMIDYLLLAAVSLTSGVQAIASAFPFLWPHRVLLSLLILGMIALVNLRGTRETGNAIAIPVYLFLFTYLPMLTYGLIRAVIDGPGDLAAIAPPALEPLTLVLILHAFATGCTALTGVEAISNAVPMFKQPKSKNAGKTLVVLSVLVGLLFLGSIGLTQYFAVVPSSNETILSALARRVLGDGPLYLLIQFSTLLILAVAANTSFTGFPRVAALLAHDSFIARQLSFLGDRLVFDNGILLLSAATAFLIIIFGGEAHALVPLFAVGAFLAFTLSQMGMVVHWWRLKGANWKLKSLINGLGAVVTGSALCIISYSKFWDGAWITFLLIPSFVFGFLRIRKHYEDFDEQMSPENLKSSISWDYVTSLQRAAIPVAHINKGTIDAIAFARLIAREVVGVHVELEEGNGVGLKEAWEHLWPNIPLHIIRTPYRSIADPLLTFLEGIDEEADDGQLTAVVLPAFVTAKWWQSFLHTQTTLQIRRAVNDANRTSGYNRTIVEVPYLLEK